MMAPLFFVSTVAIIQLSLWLGSGGGGALIDPVSYLELSAEIAAGVDSLTTPEVVIATNSYPIDHRILGKVYRHILESQQDGVSLIRYTFSDPETGTWVSYSADTGEVYCGDTYEEVSDPRLRNA